MFNAPRRMGGASLSSSAFINSSNSASTGYADPLASSVPAPSGSYGDLDPWSAVPSPALSGTPRRDSGSAEAAPRKGNGDAGKDGLSALINDPPALYVSLLDQVDPSHLDDVSITAVHRLLGTSKLPAVTVEKIINLTSRDKSSLTRQEFFCALALVALAQSDPDTDTEISIERLSAAFPDLPLPAFSPSSGNSSSAQQRSPPRGFDAATSPTDVVSPSASTGFNAWDTAPRHNGHSSAAAHDFGNDLAANSEQIGSGSALSSEGAANGESQKGYYKRLENVEVTLIAEKEGWFLQKYKVESDKRSAEAVSRRYSDFVWLLDCLVKRYPFRLLPALPPKRIGPDASFLEQRRKGLRRFINAIVNHPVLKDDGALNVFLTEPAFESWRKRTKVSTDEESLQKKLNPAQEMSIPADLEEKLGVLRDHLPAMLGSYQKLVVLAERALARLQTAAGDASRFALSLHSVGEELPRCCYRQVPEGQGRCSLCEGIGRGLGEVGETWTRVAEESEKRAATSLQNHIEALKVQRDLYLAFRDLFIRHDKLSKDNVDGLRKKVEQRQKKMDTLKSAAKAGWEVEVDKLVAANDQDNSTISALLSRRVFIRASMWHELAVVHHSRQAAQITLSWRSFAKEQRAADQSVVDIWEALAERLESMPVE